MYDPNNNKAAWAASGGCMGGDSFSSSSEEETSYSSYSSSESDDDVGVEQKEKKDVTGWGIFWIVVMVGIAVLPTKRTPAHSSTGTRSSVIKLQVGLSGMGRALQTELNRIAEVADTSTSKGLSYVLTESTQALLRHPDYCISSYSSVDVKGSVNDGEKRFKQLTIEERVKFDEETLVNVNNIRRKSKASQEASGFSNEYMVITILVAAKGENKLPPINGRSDLKEALQKLASIPTSKTLAVRVLWTPQDENDTLSEKEMLEDYPELRPL